MSIRCLPHREYTIGLPPPPQKRQRGNDSPGIESQFNLQLPQAMQPEPPHTFPAPAKRAKTTSPQKGIQKARIPADNKGLTPIQEHTFIRIFRHEDNLTACRNAFATDIQG